MSLFDQFERTETRYREQNEGAFRYMNLSARPGIAAIRDVLEEWFGRLPEQARADVRGRFREDDQVQHCGAFFELFWHELLTRAGYEVLVHPSVPGANTTPDFLASRDSVPSFYVEATLAMPAGGPAEERRFAELLDTLNRMDLPDFYLEVEYRGMPRGNVGGRTIRNKLERWLREISYEAVRRLYDSGEFDAVPSLSFDVQGAALIVASEVHSRVLSTFHAPGELRGLFGDGACAFVLRPEDGAGQCRLNFGGFTFGCSGELASALEATLGKEMKVEFQFKGDQLGRAAVDRLLRLTEQLELMSGRSRSEATAFAIHEPNPRLAQIFAQNAGIALEKIAFVSRTFGNLGSATCGVSLCLALDRIKEAEDANRSLIFVAAVGPGLLWAGTYLR